MIEKLKKWLLGLVPISIGLLFIGGTFLNAVGLSYFPQIVHTIVGVGLVVIGLMGFAGK